MFVTPPPPSRRHVLCICWAHLSAPVLLSVLLPSGDGGGARGSGFWARVLPGVSPFLRPQLTASCFCLAPRPSAFSGIHEVVPFLGRALGGALGGDEGGMGKMEGYIRRIRGGGRVAEWSGGEEGADERNQWSCRRGGGGARDIAQSSFGGGLLVRPTLCVCV